MSIRRFTVEAQGFLRLGAGFSGYAAGFYLFNPKEKIDATGFSVPDAYMLRSGVDYMVAGVHGLTLSLGGRWEGIPPEDAIGKSRGSRRPGYAMSVEPGVNYTKGRFTINFALPVAVVRNRQMTKGATRKGDAAFADYTFNTSLSYRL
jgi:hypothetical protein